MQCLNLETKCRLCGVSFSELLCKDNGVVWKDARRHPLEDGVPWCPCCVEQINATCDALGAGVAPRFVE